MLMNRQAKQFLVICGTALALAWGAVAAEPAAVYFKTPDEAVKGLIKAAQVGTDDAIKAVVGPDFGDIGSGDPVADAEERRLFAARASVSFRTQPFGDNRLEILLGADEWPFAIPLVKEDKGWRFDGEAGLQELANRRVGRNELSTIDAIRAYVDAQNEYAARNPMVHTTREYAQRLGSTNGKHDGLYWPVADGEKASPLGPLFAKATMEGYDLKQGAQPAPYHGYIYHILKGQGAKAPGGAKSYVKNGHMTEGFGLIAYPVEYGNSGVMTFIVSERGLIFQKDLGKDTAALAEKITVYDPDKTWDPVREP